MNRKRERRAMVGLKTMARKTVMWKAVRECDVQRTVVVVVEDTDAFSTLVCPTARMVP